ncbi:hypothetical protein [Ferruginibacter sp. SUN106]|uniref:hypothetical protein n=1 Tax=Ferruginibacter sp. SUN106 TaxID=2978348 RepID=UPI003D364890
MKIFKSVILVLAIVVAFLSCQKEIAFDNNGVSAGAFKKDAGGNCLPVTVTGVFKVDSALTNALFVDIQVNVTTPGTFEIKSDTINGFSFSRTGSVVFGTNTIRLYGSGKPLAAGTNTFTVKYGISTCSFSITVINSSTSNAVFTLDGSPGICASASVAGTYTVGVALTPANTLTIQVNVTATGTYAIGAATTSGFLFTGSGVFTLPGLQNVTLTGTGTPLTAGPATVTVLNIAGSTCTYDINVLPVGGAAAVFTLDGAPNTCTNFIVNGTYTATIPVTASNNVKLNVTVTTAGSYSVTTNTVDGITFSGSGTLAAGAQVITLTASGTPTTLGTFNTFKPNITNSCDFAVTVAAAPAPAVYTLSGAPSACAPITVNGTYAGSTALNATNTAVVQVNVSSPGSYTLTTNTVNGMTFSATGIFTATGIQPVTLQGSGTPGAAATTSTFTPQTGTSSCTFDVVVAAAPTGILTCKIDGVQYTFNFLAQGTYFVPGDLLMSGYTTATNSEGLVLDIDKSSTGGTVTTGTYVNTLLGSTTGGYILGANYKDLNAVTWSPKSILSTPDPFTIIITSLTATTVTGTFSGTVRENFGSGTNTKSITNGVFNLPIH